MKETTIQTITWFFVSILIAGVTLWLLFSVVFGLIFFLNYDNKPDIYEKNLSNKELIFNMTGSYFMSLVPEHITDRYRLSYNKEDKNKRSIWLSPNSTDLETYSLENVNYNSKELDSFINIIGISKEQLDTLETYLNYINCNYISSSLDYDNYDVKLKMKEGDFTSYFYYDSVSHSRHYAIDTVNHREFCNSIITRKGKHILIKSIY